MTRRIAMLGADSSSLSTALLAGAMIPIVARPEDDGFTSHGEFYPYPKAREKTPTRCALPGCPRETTHNGGYCCADHCREHRQRQRAANAEGDPMKGAT
jgi:hypothetical protein